MVTVTEGLTQSCGRFCRRVARKNRKETKALLTASTEVCFYLLPRRAKVVLLLTVVEFLYDIKSKLVMFKTTRSNFCKTNVTVEIF